MSQPLRHVKITTPEGGTEVLRTAINSASFYTVLREDRLPKGGNSGN